jgi:Protein of unknown function (DUF3131)
LLSTDGVVGSKERRITTYLRRYKAVTLAQRLVNYKKTRSLRDVRLVSLQASLEAKSNKFFFKQNRWRFSKKAKYLLVFAIITIMFVSIFAFLPKGSQSTPNIDPQSNDPSAAPSPTTQQTPSASKKPDVISGLGQMINNMVSSATQIIAPPKPPGIIESAEYINSTIWKAVAANSWQYFQPGIGVDPNTGLPYAGLGWPYFTDWDLGVYIQAVIDANITGLISKDGEWGFTSRLDKVLRFLETRELNDTTHYPFWFYEAATGKNYKLQSDLATFTVDTVDTGKLFVALNNLRDYHPDWKSRINDIVISGRSNYTVLLNDIRSASGSNSIYAYYVVSGFAAFWPEVADIPGKILNNILSGTPVNVGDGITLPASEISCEPLLQSIFELKNNTKLMDLAKNVYLAHEARFNATGQYIAFSEGNSNYNTFIYEWVILPTGETWKVTKIDRSIFDINPIIYTKVALSFLALYNTTYARNMAIYLEKNLSDPTNGYCDGSSYSTDSDSSNLVTMVGSNTNGLILSAARYAMQNI